jgi:DNA-binding response OmpR family regulator
MQRPHPGNGVILIAERDQQVRKLQQHFLSAAGFAIDFADDGEAALDRARLERPALVVTEILIPKLDGLALCRRLREDPFTRNVPVLVFSILAAEVRASEAGASAFLRKPLVDSIFLAAVQALVAAGTTSVVEASWVTK